MLNMCKITKFSVIYKVLRVYIYTSIYIHDKAFAWNNSIEMFSTARERNKALLNKVLKCKKLRQIQELFEFTIDCRKVYFRAVYE